MRDPARIDRILALLATYWHANPDLRLGQIVGNFTPHRWPLENEDPYYVEDNVYEAALLAATRPAKTEE